MAEWTKVASVKDLAPGGKIVVDVDGQSIALYHVEGKFYATDDICTHDGGPLAYGALEGYEIVCPRHGARFDVRTGKALCMPAFVPIDTYPVKVEGQDILVDIE
jgi:3-phenylpropionate/trans-cinnamate dioxygenase ferredoxin component